MKKKIIIFTVIAITLLLVLFMPFSKVVYDDGGTIEYSALTYKIVKWSCLVPVHNEEGTIERIETYKETSVYWFPDNFKSIGELWEMEQGNN